MSEQRQYSAADRLVMGVDRALRAVSGGASREGRPSPAEPVTENGLDHLERRRSVGLMRVNHAGEVAAQALYHGQTITARTPGLRRELDDAANEEGDHMEWCRERVEELGGRTSHLDPLWYGASFLIGAAAGLVGDRVSRGFVAETERQVVEHLNSHLRDLPLGDSRSRAILEQMKIDEGLHRTRATLGGAVELPKPVRSVMGVIAKVMTRSAYWV